jgi:hypothetical protein
LLQASTFRIGDAAIRVSGCRIAHRATARPLQPIENKWFIVQFHDSWRVAQALLNTLAA